MTSPVTLERRGRIGVLRIDHPPVNALSREVIAGLSAGLAAFEADATYAALLVACEGRTFVAGGDITGFDDPNFDTSPYNGFLARLEASARPVAAVLHGTTLGGGLELALACHYRVAVPGTKFGFPEVKLGLLPGSLGTQRAPRAIGMPLALDLIRTGRLIGTDEALKAGLVDELKSGPPLTVGLAYVEALVARHAAPRRLSEIGVPHVDAAQAALDKAAAEAARKPAYPAQASIVRALQAAVSQRYAQAEVIEAREFDTLRRSATSRAMRHLFFAEREAARIPGLPAAVKPRQVEKVGVVGAGTMGGGIAMALANAGVPVVLLEAKDDALQRGVALIRKNYEATAAKGKLTAEQVATRIGLITPTLDDAQLADCDLVIEAVFENMDLKKSVLARLGRVCPPGAVIASNTSTLDVDQLAQASGRPADVVGMHFFSPANVMRLLEVVRGQDTAPEVLATAMALGRRIGKVAVVSGVCYGFIGNRMAEVYMRETEFLLMEGAQPQQIDQAVEALGLAMGPCRMLDMAGIDVGAKTVIEYGKAGGLPPDASYRAVVRRLFEIGRHGQKTNAGYYRYEGRTPVPDPQVVALSGTLAHEHGILRRGDITADEIVARLLYPLINEGVRILEEGIAYRPGDIDVVWTAGYGFPDHRGGPMWMADDIGLAKIVERMHRFARERGNDFGYWTVSPLLEKLAAEGQRLSDWTPT